MLSIFLVLGVLVNPAKAIAYSGDAYECTNPNKPSVTHCVDSMCANGDVYFTSQGELTGDGFVSFTPPKVLLYLVGSDPCKNKGGYDDPNGLYQQIVNENTSVEGQFKPTIEVKELSEQSESPLIHKDSIKAAPLSIPKK